MIIQHYGCIVKHCKYAHNAVQMGALSKVSSNYKMRKRKKISQTDVKKMTNMMYLNHTQHIGTRLKVDK